MRPGQERIKNVERLLHEYGEKATEAAEAKAKLVRAVGGRRGYDITVHLEGG